MSSRRLLARTPSAIFMTNARLFQHQLQFNHASEIDGSAKCNAMYTGDSRHAVHGVLFQININEKPILDQCESLGVGYEEKVVRVQSYSNETIEALTYTSLRVREGLQAFDWYKQHVLHGAMEHGLPEDYLAYINSISSVNDTDRCRHEREIALYVCDTQA